eukprot:4362327-Amphidinium_carterae.1
MPTTWNRKWSATSVHASTSMLLQKGRITQVPNNKRFCCWQVSYQAELERPSFSHIGKVIVFFSKRTADKRKTQPPQPRSMVKLLPWAFETQNMSDGRSAE